MRTITSLVMMLAALPCALAAEGGEISASGTATVTVPPDMAEVHLSIITRDVGPDAAADGNAAVYGEVVKRLGALGFDKDEIVTMTYRVDTEFEYDRTSGERRITGYKATHRIKVGVDDLLRTGKVIDAALEAGATEVSGIEYSSSKIEDARREALSLAVVRARESAATIAETLGGKIGDLVEISTGEKGMPVVPLAMTERAGASSTVVVPDEISVSSTVSGSWRFVQDGE